MSSCFSFKKGLFDCAVKRSLSIAEKAYGYPVSIWFPVCHRSVYGKWGGETLYGDEPFNMPDWNGPETQEGEDRGDEKFLPAERKLIVNPNDPGYYKPDWTGNAVVIGLDRTENTVGDWSGDPYTDDDTLYFFLPSTLSFPPPSSSKVVIDISDEERLHFITKAPAKVAGGWKPNVVKIPLQAAEHV